MVLTYEHLCATKTATGWFFGRDFDIAESNDIIHSIVKRVEQFAQARGMETTYDTVVTEKGDRIVRANMTSKDGVIRGKVEYSPPWASNGACSGATVSSDFQFTLDDPSLKPEYFGLAKILQSMKN